MPSEATKKHIKKWTIIIFMNAENNLMADTVDLYNEIASVGSSYEVNIVVIFDGLSTPQMPEYKEYPSVYYVQKNVFFEKAIPEVYFIEKEMDNLANPENLKKAIQYATKKFPAEHIAFVYAGHGGSLTTDVAGGKFKTMILKRDIELTGSDDEKEEQLTEWLKKKVAAYNYRQNRNKKKSQRDKSRFEYHAYDTKDGEGNIILLIMKDNSAEDELSYEKLRKALAVFENNKLAFFCLDCCWGMSIESTFLFRDIAHYFVASPDEMPSTGLGYREMLMHLLNRPRITPEELSKLMVSLYYYRNYADYESQEEFSFMGTSLTCVDMDKTVIDRVSRNFSELCKYLSDRMPEKHNLIRDALSKCVDYTYSENDQYEVHNIDLCWFLENIIHFNRGGKIDSDSLADVQDKELHILLSNLLINIKTHLIKGFLSNNYPTLQPGETGIGARGITITYPKTIYLYLRSSLNSLKSVPSLIAWKNLLYSFYAFNNTAPRSLNYFLNKHKDIRAEWIKRKYLYKRGSDYLLKKDLWKSGPSDVVGKKWKKISQQSAP